VSEVQGQFQFCIIEGDSENEHPKNGRPVFDRDGSDTGLSSAQLARSGWTPE
jgi:hypothetical protein